jgi:hypothetical protein
LLGAEYVNVTAIGKADLLHCDCDGFWLTFVVRNRFSFVPFTLNCFS